MFLPRAHILIALSLLGITGAWAQETFFDRRRAAAHAPALPGDELQRQKESFLSAPGRAGREAAAKTLVSGGEPGARLLLDTLDEWLARQADSATRPPGARTPSPSGSDRKELERLQAEIQSLRGEEDLTHERIAQVADPAMQKIQALLRSIARSEQEVRRGVAAEFDAYRRAAARMIPSPAPGAGGSISPAKADDLDGLYARAAARAVQQWNREQARRIPPDWAEGIEDLNRIRMLAGLNPLRTEVQLCKAAEDHSKDMATLNFFDHESPVPGKKTFSDRAKRFETTASGENIFAGSTSPRSANQGWFYSPGHHKNMMTPGHQHVGLGRYGDRWTQLFR